MAPEICLPAEDDVCADGVEAPEFSGERYLADYRIGGGSGVGEGGGAAAALGGEGLGRGG